MSYIFVYGLLKSTYTNNAALFIRKKCTLLGNGVASGRMFDLGSYPGIVHETDSDYQIHGEVYRIDTDKTQLIQFLDRFEECGPEYDQPNEYRRELIPVTVNGTVYQASAYLYNRNLKGLKLIDSGKYEDIQGHR